MTRRETLDWAKSIIAKIFGETEHNCHNHTEIIHGWLARDHWGLTLFMEKPKFRKHNNLWVARDRFFALPNTMFPTITTEDTEPTPVTISIQID